MATVNVNSTHLRSFAKKLNEEKARQEGELIDRMEKTIRAWTHNKPTREPGILPTTCTGNIHVFALCAARCKCGAIEQ